MEPRPPSDSHSVLTRWLGIADSNTAGYVHGGVIMRFCDEVAGIAAVRHSGLRVVTAAMDRMTFLQAVHIGQLLTVHASVNAAWRTSMEVGVRVTAEDIRKREAWHVSTAYLTMVAVDGEGRPTQIPPLAPESPAELRRAREAQVRRDNRLAERAGIEAERARSEDIGAHAAEPRASAQTESD